MTTAFKLLAKVVQGKAPARILYFGLRNTLNRKIGRNRRRYEFERLYLEEGDPWQFASSSYEREKYAHTLARLLEYRHGDKAVLELGCSVGVFSDMLASHFGEVAALDFSSEALATAARRYPARKNIRWLQGYIQDLKLDRRFDAVICAEVLYYILENESERTCTALERHLAPGGILMTVAGIPTAPDNEHHFNGWERVLSARFRPVFKERVEDGMRPYEILIFERNPE